jgi:hypothetical protein
MKRRRSTTSIPLMFAGLAAASAETIMRRTLMMARGTCSPAEYRRMVGEKQAAALATGRALMRGTTDAATLLAPWSKRAGANAKRLRRKKV